MYRAALVVSLLLVIAALFTLDRPNTPGLRSDPISFDGDRAVDDMRTIVADFPQRVAGSDADDRAGIWLYDQFGQIGLETHTQGFTASIEGKDVALRNVWAVAKGEKAGTILVVANRDVPPLTTQGANDNASGVAALLELARSFTVTTHDHTIVFAATSGDAYGALGARQLMREWQDEGRDELWAVIALRRMASQERRAISVDGWSPAAKTAPPWLWLLTRPAARAQANDNASVPGITAQIINLAAPTSAGSQGPFVAAGVPAVTIGADGRQVAPIDDTLDSVSNDTLRRTGSTAQAMIMAIDGAQRPEARSGGAIFLTSSRTLPGWSLAMVLGGGLLPLIAVTVDLYAHCRRGKVALRPALVRTALHLAPWLIVIAIVYLANLVGLLPKSPGAVVPPASPLVDNPSYVRVALLVGLLAAVYVYAVSVERRMERAVPNDPRATIFIAHLILVVIAVVAALVNPYSLLLVLPAALLWPLARPGSWPRAVLVPYAGLAMIFIVMVYLSLRLDVGWKVWWYFLLLIEMRTIPVSVVVLGVLFVSVAAMLAHTLHDRAIGTRQLGWTVPATGDAGEASSSPRRRRRAGRVSLGLRAPKARRD